MTRLAVVTLFVLALLANAAGAPAAATQAAKPCAKQAKAVKTFKKQMPKAKRRYFRTHRSAKARKKFVRKQNARLKALKRKHQTCLRNQIPPAPPLPSPPDPPAPPPPTPGGLAGAPNAPALDAVADVAGDDALVAASEVTDGVVRTQVELAFRKDATVEGVNALLRRIGGRIVSSRAGVLITVIEIPDPGSLAALEALIASLEADPVVRIAHPVLLVPAAELPEHIGLTFPGGDLDRIRAQLAVRAHAAWNAKAALDGRTPPTFVIPDFFGNGPPGAGIDVATVATDYLTDPQRVNDHGYLVLGLAAGTYEATGVGTVAEEGVTGIFPGRLNVRAVDLAAGIASGALQDRALTLIENAPGDVVLNTSLTSSKCLTAEEVADFCSREYAIDAAELWIERVRGTNPNRPGANLEGQFVNATAAGNIGLEPVGAAQVSAWSASRLISELPVPNLTNTLVVENFTPTATQPFQTACAAASSELGGTIAAVGAPVHSFASPTAARLFADGGTSSATPQVAALAAYVWALKPSLSPTQVVSLLERTARESSCGGGGSVMDAYAAVLATDAGNPSQPARLAVFDVADAAGEPGADGRFDDRDLEDFLAHFDSAVGTIDYGRYDPNGDGVVRSEVGVERRDRVDLDADEAFEADTAQEIEGVTVHFDERSLTDENVLCHAAYSPLWDGTEAERRARLGVEPCVRPAIDTTFPDRVRASDSNTLTVTASALEIEDAAGDPVPLEDVHIELTPREGTTVNAPLGQTNADGVYATSATLAAGHPTLTIDVAAFDEPGGDLLDEATITADLRTTGTIDIEDFYAQLMVRAGLDDGDDVVESPGSWSMSGSAADGGGSASASVSATWDDSGGRLVYEGSGTLTASSGGAASIIHGLQFNVVGGEVRWNLTQRLEPHPLRPFFQVNGRPAANGGGLLEPGFQIIEFEGGGGAAAGEPSMNTTYTWKLEIGPG